MSPQPRKTRRKREPFLLNRAKAAFELGICVSSLDGLVRRGELACVKIGTRSLFVREELARFAFERLECRHSKVQGIHDTPESAEESAKEFDLVN